MNNGIYVNTGTLGNFGTYLTNSSQNINMQLSQIQAVVSQISNSWTDNVGQEYISSFNSFMAKSKEISQLMSQIGSEASNKADLYSGIINNALNKMR